MKKILYVNGYKGSANGSSANLIKQEFTDYEVYSIDYNDNDCSEARNTISKFIYDNNIDICIGSSM